MQAELIQKLIDSLEEQIKTSSNEDKSRLALVSSILHNSLHFLSKKDDTYQHSIPKVLNHIQSVCEQHQVLYTN